MAYKVDFFIFIRLISSHLFVFSLGATIPNKPQTQTGSTKMDTEHETYASASSEPSSAKAPEPPKAESDPESELGL